MATAAIAEYLYKVSLAWKTKGYIPVTNRSLNFFKNFLGVSQAYTGAIYYKTDEAFNQIHAKLLSIGDSYIRRVMFHSHDGRLPEEFTRDQGFERGAKDLTWSYAAIITAADAREALLAMN